MFGLGFFFGDNNDKINTAILKNDKKKLVSLINTEEINSNLSKYLEKAIEINNPDSFVTLMDIASEDKTLNITYSESEKFNLILDSLMKERQYNFIQAILDKEYYLDSFGVFINKCIILYSIKINDKKIFDMSLPYTGNARVEEVEVVNTVLLENHDFFDYIYKNHKYILEYAESEGSFASLNYILYEKLKMKQKINYF